MVNSSISLFVCLLLFNLLGNKCEKINENKNDKIFFFCAKLEKRKKKPFLFSKLNMNEIARPASVILDEYCRYYSDFSKHKFRKSYLFFSLCVCLSVKVKS